MKKIGLMTWFTHNNYGSVLQAYALGETIKNENFIIEYINYEPKPIAKNIFERSLNKNIDSLYERIMKNKVTKSKKKIDVKYAEFRKKLNASSLCNGFTDLKSISNQYDSIVCGSDQIWSPNAYDENYFLVFADNIKKIAYAPSFGVTDIYDINLKNKIRSMVNSFDFVSVREEDGKNILNNKDIIKTLDPTLLLNSQEWIKKLNLTNNNFHKYILCYFLGNNKKYYNYAKKIAKEKKLELLIIPTNSFSINKRGKVLYDCGPKEFVEYIYNASLILTDSYHGMLFSINFNKNFVIFERFNNNRESQNSRIYSTLNEFSLFARLYSNIKNNNAEVFETNYTNVNKILNEKRRISIDFLNESLHFEKKGLTHNYEITKMCTGCGMCAAICPQKCISIKINKNGFYEYSVDKEKCINCDMCKKICGQCKNNVEIINGKKIYACKSNNKDVLISSASGGIGTELSRLSIENNINVIGCTYNYEKNIAEHVVIDSMNEIGLLKGSKYLQSYTVDAFSKLKKMKNGVVIGTPCQIASVDNYLRLLDKRDSFILIDLICHGVPTYNLLYRLLDGKRIKNINFRNKRNGWHSKILTIDDKKISDKKFYDFFESNSIFNRCCYDCNYRNGSSADIRIGDFWGKKYQNNNDGMSMVIICTKNGKRFFDSINQKDIERKEENTNDYVLNQQSKNIALPSNYYTIMDLLANKKLPLNQIYNKYFYKIVLERKIRKILRKIVG